MFITIYAEVHDNHHNVQHEVEVLLAESGLYNVVVVVSASPPPPEPKPTVSLPPVSLKERMR